MEHRGYLAGCRPCGARGAHGAPGYVCLTASMNPDAHVCCTSPPHSVPSPGAMLSSMAQNPGYLNDAACAVCAVCGRHPLGSGAGELLSDKHVQPHHAAACRSTRFLKLHMGVLKHAAACCSTKNIFFVYGDKNWAQQELNHFL